MEVELGIGHPTLQSKVTLLPVIIRPIYIIYIHLFKLVLLKLSRRWIGLISIRDTSSSQNSQFKYFCGNRKSQVPNHNLQTSQKLNAGHQLIDERSVESEGLSKR